MDNNLKDEIKSGLSDILKTYSCEHNTEYIRNAINTDICNYLTLLRNNKKIYDFQCICDTSNNDENAVLQNQFKCRVGIKFTESPEFTVFDITSTLKDSTFEDVLK